MMLVQFDRMLTTGNCNHTCYQHLS